jgi:hypothetical protein
VTDFSAYFDDKDNFEIDRAHIKRIKGA